MARMIRNARPLLKPALLVAAVLLAGGCREGGRAAVDAADAPAWPEQVAEPRAPAPRPPLLVLLHGLGGDEHDLLRLAPYVDPRLRVVSVRAPRRYGSGFSWFPMDVRRDGTVRPHAAEARAALLDLARWLAAAPARLGTDPERTFVLGFSQGAMMVVGLVRTYPERLAGAIVLSGAAVEDTFPPVAPAAAVRRVPLFVGHGTNDEVVPVAEGRRIRTAATAAGGEVAYHEYPIAHGVNEAEMRDVAAWLAARLDAEEGA